MFLAHFHVCALLGICSRTFLSGVENLLLCTGIQVSIYRNFYTLVKKPTMAMNQEISMLSHGLFYFILICNQSINCKEIMDRHSRNVHWQIRNEPFFCINLNWVLTMKVKQMLIVHLLIFISVLIRMWLTMLLINSLKDTYSS